MSKRTPRPPTGRAKKGETFAKLADLQAAVRAFAVSELATIWNVPESAVIEAPLLPMAALYETPAEREARDVFDRLQSAARDALAFARTHGNGSALAPGLGTFGNNLCWWAQAFNASPLAIWLVHQPPTAAPLPSAHAELTNLVRAWDEERAPLMGQRDSNRTLALMALRAGFWPAPPRTKRWSEIKVRELVNDVTRTVNTLRAKLETK